MAMFVYSYIHCLSIHVLRHTNCFNVFTTWMFTIHIREYTRVN